MEIFLAMVVVLGTGRSRKRIDIGQIKEGKKGVMSSVVGLG